MKETQECVQKENKNAACRAMHVPRKKKTKKRKKECVPAERCMSPEKRKKRKTKNVCLPSDACPPEKKKKKNVCLSSDGHPPKKEKEKRKKECVPVERCMSPEKRKKECVPVERWTSPGSLLKRELLMRSVGVCVVMLLYMHTYDR